MVQLLRGADANLQGLYLPALRELKTLFANGCDQFDPDRWYWSSTQFSRNGAFGQHFYDGDTNTSARVLGWWELPASSAFRYKTHWVIDSLISFPARSAGRSFFQSYERHYMTTSTIPHCTVALPAIGTPAALWSTFWACSARQAW